MRNTLAIPLSLILLFMVSGPQPLFAQRGGPDAGEETVVFEEVSVKEPIAGKAQPIVARRADLETRVKSAQDSGKLLSVLNEAIDECASYEDYENLAASLKRMISSPGSYKETQVLRYGLAKTRVEELAYLARNNNIESGRIYMSVNEKYYNEALEALDKIIAETKSKDLELDANFLKFVIFKELFQQEKADAAFAEIVEIMASYSGDMTRNIDKLDEMSGKFSQKGLNDYAMKLKFVYASRVDPESAKSIAAGIKDSADALFQEEKNKEAMTTYNTYLEIAGNYYDRETMSASLMDIAEKYFEKGRYKDAIKYYSQYLLKYPDMSVADYCSYRLALSYYYDRDYAAAASRLEDFLKTYQNSVWFEKGFEALCRLDYETLPIDQAIESLDKLIQEYPRRDTRDYAYLLTGILYYNKTDYAKALETLKKIGEEVPRSAYVYTADSLMNDIKEIKKGQAPSYSFGSEDLYKIWEPYMYINADIAVSEGAQTMEKKDAAPGEIFIETSPGSRVVFDITGLEDMDRFNEYWQDSEDESRLPRKVRDETEKDLVFLTWSGAEGGKFLDDKQTLSKEWQAPDTPGEYTMTVNIGDIGLVRPPDSGSKKDPAKVLTVHIKVE